MSPPRDDEPPSEPPDGLDEGNEPDPGDDSGAGGSESGESGSELPDGAAGPVDRVSDAGSGDERDEPLGRTDEADPLGHADEDGRPSVSVNGGTPTADAPPARRGDAEAAESGVESGARTFVVDVVSSALAVLLVGAMLFAVSGVWPPMVAIESPSMTPHMKTGDLVFVMDEQRFPGDGAVGDTGVVTLRSGQDSEYLKFQRPGDVIVYKPDGSESATPIIHRAMFYVEEGENWYDEADRQSLGRYSECGETQDEALPYCPAPHAGFITKGDANGGYDQANQLSGPVRSEWIVGTAEVRIPKLGCIRLRDERCLGNDRGAVVGATLLPEAGNRSAAAR